MNWAPWLSSSSQVEEHQPSSRSAARSPAISNRDELPEQTGADDTTAHSADISAWLDTVKSGYGERFAGAFYASGVEDTADVVQIDSEIFAEIEVALSAAGAKAMQMKNIREAIVEVGAELETPRPQLPANTSSARPIASATSSAGASSARAPARSGSPTPKGKAASPKGARGGKRVVAAAHSFRRSAAPRAAPS